MDIILIAGLWLKASVWDDVASGLRRHGHRPLPLKLPGVDDGSTTATLDDQVAAALTATDSAERPVIVGHSAASTLAWIVADRRPDSIDSVVMVGGFPSADGNAYADLFEAVDGVMAFPGWGPFEGADSADLDESARQDFVSNSVPVPEGVSKGIVHLSDDRRFDVPVSMVCPEFSPDDIKEAITDGEIPELAAAKHITYVDIDTGHWPMITRPVDFAGVLHSVATGG